MYHTESMNIHKDVETIQRKINKVDNDLFQKNTEKVKIKPQYEEIKNLYDINSQKLEILNETKIVLKKDIFIKKQESKMLTTRRKIRRNHINSIRQKAK